MSVRFGIGVDVHRLVDGEKLVLGGVTIPHGQGLAGHSDGDALAHAVVDALLGAAGLGDIGTHFPSSDDRYRGVASTELLSQVVEIIGERDWRVQYLDATILAEMPVLRPHIGDMRAALAAAMQITPDLVSVKATTTDGLGFVGRGQGIACMAVATVEALP
jgi:2-C-methyl-D-erythritol 2,4-cyclodiphosphate synthase